MIALFAFWQPIGGVIWEAPEGWARNSVIALNLFGWAFLFYATLLINHFDLFGLSQVWRRLRGLGEEKPRFRTPGLYGLMRHPIYVGWLIIFWAAPTMTIAHLIFSIGTTIYMLGAIKLEERDLIEQFGANYVEYRKRVPALVPLLESSRASAAIEHKA
jgi:methanethiol S-methyltransferase